MENTDVTGYKERDEGKSLPLEQAVHTIVDLHTKDLQMVIHKIRDLLKDETDELTDTEIDDIMLQLPILLFDITDNQELVGVDDSDMNNKKYVQYLIFLVNLKIF